MAKDTTKGATETAPAKPTIEDLSDEQRQQLFFQHSNTIGQRLAAKKKADADFKNACKLAKSELGKDAVEDIKLAATLNSEEGVAALREKIERQIRVARWMGAELGTQADMFSESAGGGTHRALTEGKRAHADGKPRKPPAEYAPGSPDYEFWMRGFDEGGMATIGRGPRPIGTEAPTATRQ